jgi:GDP/UDP-N,N'-diacetylbacillosamine 2-epimerase (hydrolysing)
MITLGIFTTSRADFGIYKPLLNQIDAQEKTCYKLFVGGIHIKKEEGYKISRNFDFTPENDSDYCLTKSTAKATDQLAKIFQGESFDFVCVLGDRFELLSIIQTAIIFRKPIIHIHGGEISEGAIDDQIRHMITKASHIHFAACEEYSNNIRKMGEQGWRIFNTGALAVENIKNQPFPEKKELFEKHGLDESKKTAILTYHPVTLEKHISTEEQIHNVFKALKNFDLQVVVTAPNIDSERNSIISIIEEQVKKNKDYKFFQSLGSKNYLGLVKHCDFVIGNSSSGILEVPYFKIPTINIGSRQDGRLRHESIIDTKYDTKLIKQAVEKALDPAFKATIKNMSYRFGDGQASQKMVDAIRKVANRKYLMIKKLDFPC